MINKITTVREEFYSFWQEATETARHCTQEEMDKMQDRLWQWHEEQVKKTKLQQLDELAQISSPQIGIEIFNRIKNLTNG